MLQAFLINTLNSQKEHLEHVAYVFYVLTNVLILERISSKCSN